MTIMTAKARATEVEYWTDVLARDGYCIIPDIIDTAKVEALHTDLSERFEKTPFCVGDFYGPSTKRFGGLLKRSPHAKDFIAHPLIIDIVNAMLGPFCDRMQLNLAQALQIHPGAPAQFGHRDQDMWRGATGTTEYLINVMWPFTHYTKENGATVVWPKSHRRQDEPQIDPAEAISAEMEPGSVLLFLGSTLHGAGANTSDEIRAGMIISYCLGWLKPYENQWLVYPPEIARHFSPELAALVGYQQHRPNLGNYEGQCPSVLLKGPVEDYLPAIEELRPDQLEMLAQYKAEMARLAAESGSDKK
jgi:ectoine hydroxylase-related dioxygenase (phytanoyl-CoA dioxygenase family)